MTCLLPILAVVVLLAIIWMLSKPAREDAKLHRELVRLSELKVKCHTDRDGKTDVEQARKTQRLPPRNFCDCDRKEKH